MNNDEEQKSIVPIGPNGLEFRDIDSLFRFAKAVELSGLAPKGLERKEAIFIALCMAIELRMSPMAALQNIAVINGRPGIYGDAALALVRASGHLESYSQELTGEGDTRKAIVRSSRAGVEIVNEFSVADAKRAQLWGKAGPWTQYPDRMLIFRARGFNLRDNFGDVLKGFRTTEELADIPEERSIAGRVVEPTFTGQNSRVQPPVDAVAREKALERLEEMKKVVKPPAIVADPESLAPEVMSRLAAAGISHQDFLTLLDQLAIIEADADQIEYGHFTIGHIPENTLKMVLEDWDNVISRLREAKALKDLAGRRE